MGAQNRNRRGIGSSIKQRDEKVYSVVLPPKYNKMLTRLMDGKGTNNVSEFFRSLLSEEEARTDRKAVIFSLLDASRGRLTPAIVTRILNALNRD